MEKPLQGKKVLFLSVQFFDYQNKIRQKLIELGAEVIYFDERPSNTNLAKGLIRISKSFLRNRIRKYFQQIEQKIQGQQIDYLFIIKGEVTPLNFVQKVKANNPGIVSILYLWDSIEVNGRAKEIAGEMSHVLTFDKGDADRYGFDFRPLFFTDDYRNVAASQTRPEFDLLFIGTAHTDRFLISESVRKQIEADDKSSFCYYYMHGLPTYFFKKLFEKEFKGVRIKDLKFQTLNQREILDLCAKSRVVLDIQHPGQKGLTMRSIEAIGANRKLVTTNEDIRNYEFFSENNIQVIDRTNPEVDQRFFETDYKQIQEDIYEYYSIDGWIRTLFQLKTTLNHI